MTKKKKRNRIKDNMNSMHVKAIFDNSKQYLTLFEDQLINLTSCDMNRWPDVFFFSLAILVSTDL